MVEQTRCRICRSPVERSSSGVMRHTWFGQDGKVEQCPGTTPGARPDHLERRR